jgi:hypothetical protein
MKAFFPFLFIVLVLSTTCCHAQKIVKKITDAKKLETNMQQFVGKPLKDLLAQIEPDLKYAYGNPEEKGESIAGTNIKFFFTDQAEYRKRQKLKQKPTGILVTFQTDPNNKVKPLPVGGTAWTKALAKEYENLIILRIYVTGEN